MPNNYVKGHSIKKLLSKHTDKQTCYHMAPQPCSESFIQDNLGELLSEKLLLILCVCRVLHNICNQLPPSTTFLALVNDVIFVLVSVTSTMARDVKLATAHD